MVGQMPLVFTEQLILALDERWDAFGFTTNEGRPPDNGNSFRSIGDIGRLCKGSQASQLDSALRLRLFNTRDPLDNNSDASQEYGAIDYRLSGSGNYQGNDLENIAPPWTESDMLLDIDPNTTDTSLILPNTGDLIKPQWGRQIYDVLNRYLWEGRRGELPFGADISDPIYSESSVYNASVGQQDPEVNYIQSGTGFARTFLRSPNEGSANIGLDLGSIWLAERVTVTAITLAELNTALAEQGLPPATSITSQETGIWVARRNSIMNTEWVSLPDLIEVDGWIQPDTDDTNNLFGSGWNFVKTTQPIDNLLQPPQSGVDYTTLPAGTNPFGNPNLSPNVADLHRAGDLPQIFVARADTNNLLEFTDPDINPSDDLILPPSLI